MELEKIMNQKELDLNIEVTPDIEDAFYFLRSVETDIPDAEEDESVEEYEKRLSRLCDAPVRAGQRLEKLPFEEKNAGDTQSISDDRQLEEIRHSMC